MTDAAGVDLHIHPDVAAFDARARHLFDADPVRHTLAHTGLDRMRAGTLRPELLLTVGRRGEVIGAVLRGQGRPLVVSGMPVTCASAVDAVAARTDPQPPGAIGPVREVQAHLAAHVARTGRDAAVVKRLRLFRLVTLVTPVTVPGRARRATEVDAELLARWQGEFDTEAFGRPRTEPDPAAAAQLREARAAGAGYLIWERAGEPVAYAAARRPISGMSRIGPVYTAAEQRGRGYGSAVTAAAAAWARGAGAREVVLFTDLANPTSNAIYPRIGFRPVGDGLEVAYGRP